MIDLFKDITKFYLEQKYNCKIGEIKDLEGKKIDR